MLEKLLSQKLINLLGVASIVALVTALGLTTYLTGQGTRLPIGAEANCISFQDGIWRFSTYQSTYKVNTKVCNDNDGDTQIGAQVYDDSDENIHTASGSLGVQTLPFNTCKNVTFEFNMVDDWVNKEGTVATAIVVATSRNVGDWGCYADIFKTVTFGSAEPTSTPTPTCDCDEWLDGFLGGWTCPENQLHQYRACVPSDCDTENRCVETDCSCTDWQDGDCGDWQCAADARHRYRTCTPSGCNPENQCPFDSSCQAPTPTATPVPSNKPDLIIFQIVPNADSQKIEYTVKNIGGDRAGNNYSKLIVEGSEVANDKVLYLEAGEKRLEVFESYTWSCTDELDTITVCADMYDTVQEGESGEKNNCSSLEVPCIAGTPTETPIPPSNTPVPPTNTPTPTPGDSCKKYGDEWVCWPSVDPVSTCPGEVRTAPGGVCYIGAASSNMCCYNVCPTIAAPGNVGIQIAPPAPALSFLAFANAADINGDGIIDGADASALVSSWGKRKGETGYNSKADLNNDGKVNAVDASILVSNWTK